MKWCRLHADMLNDPKVQTLDPITFKYWINALCFAAERDEGGNLGNVSDIAFAFRETESNVSSRFMRLGERGLIETDGETFHIKKWGKRQYKSDTSTERVKQYRSRIRNVSVTPPDTEQIQRKKEPSVQKKVARGSRLPDNWKPGLMTRAFCHDDLRWDSQQIESTAETFRDYWHSESGQRATKLDWDRTFKNWCRREWNRGVASGGKKGIGEIAAEMIRDEGIRERNLTNEPKAGGLEIGINPSGIPTIPDW